MADDCSIELLIGEEGVNYYVGIDASLETVNVCVVNNEGLVCLERKIEAEPEAIVELLEGFGRPVQRLGLEAGPTSSWLFSELRAAGLPAICMECRHVKAGLGAMRNKTDRNDARGIAQLVRLGWFRQVFVKSDASQRIRMLLVNRSHLIMSVEPLLNARRAIIGAFEKFDRLCTQRARRDSTCRRLMTAPGVGVIVALTYMTGVDAPERFKRSRDVGAHFGLSPKRYSSGQVDYDGRISRCGDEMVRTALYQAAHVLMHHGRWSSLRTWAMRIAKRRSMKAAKGAHARKLAVVMHRMWADATDFRWSDRKTAEASAATL